MAYINDRVLDMGLNVLVTEANALHICSQEPTNYADVATYSLGSKTDITVSGPAARTPSGRKVTVAAISDGAVTADGVATHYAVVDTVNSRLLVTGALTGTEQQRTVGQGNTFALPAFDVGIPGPA